MINRRQAYFKFHQNEQAELYGQICEAITEASRTDRQVSITTAVEPAVVRTVAKLLETEGNFGVAINQEQDGMMTLTVYWSSP